MSVSRPLCFGAFSIAHGKRVQKKSAHAEEQQRSDVLSQRRDWFAGQLALDPTRLVFVDETWASTNTAR